MTDEMKTKTGQAIWARALPPAGSATYLLQVHQRALIVASLLEVILGRFDDPIDYLGVDASLRVAVRRQHALALMTLLYSRRQVKQKAEYVPPQCLTFSVSRRCLFHLGVSRREQEGGLGQLLRRSGVECR